MLSAHRSNGALALVHACLDDYSLCVAAAAGLQLQHLSLADTANTVNNLQQSVQVTKL